MLFALGTWALFGVGLTSQSLGAKGPPRQPEALFLPAGPRAGQGLSFTADKLLFKPSQKKIILSGRVSLKSGELALKARSLEVLLNARGKPTLLKAQGEVSFQFGKSRGHAKEARLQVHDRQVTLIGAVRLRHADMALDLTGDRVQMDLATGRVSVQTVKARFHHGP